MTPGLALATGLLLAAPPTLVVSVGGPPEAPAYLAVHAAAALGVFEAEGVRVVLRRASHPTAAARDLRDGAAVVGVTTTDQAIRGAWARGLPVRILVAHTRAPAVALLASTGRQPPVEALDDLRGARIGIPGPGTSGHRLLIALLGRRGIEPWQVDPVSRGGAALVAGLAGGELAAAVVEEPWASRAVAAGAGRILLDLRRPAVLAASLGGPFYEVVSVVPAAADRAPPGEALAAYARALIRVQAWLAATPPATVVERLPPGLVRDPDALVAQLAALRDAVVPDGAAQEAGVALTLRVLREGSPWPATLRVDADDLREPDAVTAARAALGPTPPPP